MELARRILAALCLVTALSGADGVSLRAAANTALKRSAAERVELISQSMFTVESILRLPANATKAQETKVLTSLEAQVKKLEGNVQKISGMDKQQHSADAKKKSKELHDHMKGADQAMLDKMDQWSERMNRKTRLGAMDVLSKLKNAIHLVKKGALSGNKEASEKLNGVLSKMGAMAGQPTGGNFLH